MWLKSKTTPKARGSLYRPQLTKLAQVGSRRTCSKTPISSSPRFLGCQPSVPKIPQAKRENSGETPTGNVLDTSSGVVEIQGHLLEQRKSLKGMQKTGVSSPSPGSEISPDPGPNNRLMRIRNRRSVERAPSERRESSAMLERQSASRNVKF
jgi:hypothetical protein